MAERRVAVVTGADGALGRAICRELASQGFRVVPATRRRSSEKELMAEFDERPLVADVRDLPAMRAGLDRIVADHGTLDVVVNNAGVNRPMPWMDVTEDDWDVVVDTNLKAAFFIAQAAARRMIDCGNGGTIINLASQAGLVAVEDRSAYCSSKGGLISLTKSLALDLAPVGITVNAVAPTFVQTALTESTLSNPAVRQRILSRIPLGRLGEASDVASAVAYLASPAARFITGHVLVVDGGWTIV